MSVLSRFAPALFFLGALLRFGVHFQARRAELRYSTSMLYDLGVLTIAPSAGESPEMPDYATATNRPWDIFKDVTKVVVQGYTHIGKNAFANFVGVTEIQLDEGLVAIKESAFQNLPKLSHVTLPQSLTSTAQYAFRDCTNLSTVHFYGGSGDFSNLTFNGCPLIDVVNTTASYPSDEFAGFPVEKSLVIRKVFPTYPVGAASGVFIAFFAFVSAFVFVADRFAIGKWGCRKKNDDHIVPA